MKTNPTSPRFLRKYRRPQGPTRWAAETVKTAVACALVSLTASAFAEPRYTLTELPTPAGYEFSVAYHINDQGFVAGASTRPNDPNGMVATVWKNGAATLLGQLKDGTYSLANAINSKGVVPARAMMVTGVPWDG